MSDQDHFTLHAAGKPTARGRFVRADLKPVSFAPGLDFRPVLGERMLATFALPRAACRRPAARSLRTADRHRDPARAGVRDRRGDQDAAPG
jgi:hypothetical protein